MQWFKDIRCIATPGSIKTWLNLNTRYFRTAAWSGKNPD